MGGALTQSTPYWAQVNSRLVILAVFVVVVVVVAVVVGEGEASQLQAKQPILDGWRAHAFDALVGTGEFVSLSILVVVVVVEIASLSLLVVVVVDSRSSTYRQKRD